MEIAAETRHSPQPGAGIQRDRRRRGNLRRAPAPAADVRAGRGQQQGGVRREQPRIGAIHVRVAADDKAALGALRGELQPAGSGQPQQIGARPAVADVKQVAGGRIPGIVTDVDALARRPGSLERDRQGRRVRVRAGWLAVGDLDGALAGLPAPDTECRVLLVGGDDVDRLGARIARPSGWVMEDRHGVRRARVLDPNGMLRVGGVGLVHQQEPAECVCATVRVEDRTGAGGPAVVEVQATARRRRNAARCPSRPASGRPRRPEERPRPCRRIA